MHSAVDNDMYRNEVAMDHEETFNTWLLHRDILMCHTNVFHYRRVVLEWIQRSGLRRYQFRHVFQATQ